MRTSPGFLPFISYLNVLKLLSPCVPLSSRPADKPAVADLAELLEFG